MLKAVLKAVGHLLFIAALVGVIAFFFLGVLDQLPRVDPRPERPRGAASGGSP